MHNVHEELIRYQGNNPEIQYSVFDPRTLVYVQDSRGNLWKPDVVSHQTDDPDSY